MVEPFEVGVPIYIHCHHAHPETGQR
jgi:hypothetical protein